MSEATPGYKTATDKCWFCESCGAVLGMVKIVEGYRRVTVKGETSLSNGGGIHFCRLCRHPNVWAKRRGIDK